MDTIFNQPAEYLERYHQLMCEKEWLENTYSSTFFNESHLFRFVYQRDALFTAYIKLNSETGQVAVIGDNDKAKCLLDADDRFYPLNDNIEMFGCVARPNDKYVAIFDADGMVFMYAGYRSPYDYRLDLSSIKILTTKQENIHTLADKVISNLVSKPKENRTPTQFFFVTSDRWGGLKEEGMEFEQVDIDIKKQYNDDLPYDKIIQQLTGDRKAFILFDGAPGTGKTTLLKKIAQDIKNQSVYFMDTRNVMKMSADEFIKFVTNRKKAIIILEDSEGILMNREQGNPFISTLLNLTDGLIADALRPKFICTINCSEKKIDQAFLRKGRLTLKYTFNPLCLEKTRLFVKDAQKPMTLADIFNPDENIISTPQQRTIGFRKAIEPAIAKTTAS